MTTKTHQPSAATIADFYDDFSQRLLRDYVYGNPRVRAAIETVCAAITTDVNSVLDIGCGIGASSFEYARRHAHVKVHGVDISPRNIETARKLFEDAQCSFHVRDVTTDEEPERYDLVAMLDVYEHIPRHEWARFNAALGQWLSDDGTLVLTTPSPLHQAWLAEHNPEGLQMIDETVRLEDILNLAADVGAEVMQYRSASIWRSNDYIHAVMTRNLRYERVRVQPQAAQSLLRCVCNKIGRTVWSPSSPIELRRRHVMERLGVEV